MANNRDPKERTRRHPDTDDQKPQRMTTEQLPTGEITRIREKGTSATSEITHTKGAEVGEMQTETTRICHREKTLPNVANGLHTLNIAIINPGSMKEEKMRRSIIKNIARGKIHTATVQQTHITIDRNCLLGRYRIITESETRSETTGVAQGGGVAAAIHDSIHQNITQIARQSRRVLRITLGRKNSKIPTWALFTHWPPNGRKEENRRHRRNEVNEILYETCIRHMVIWRKDPNGQRVRDGEEEGQSATQNHASARITGPYTRRAKQEKEMVNNYRKYARSRK